MCFFWVEGGDRTIPDVVGECVRRAIVWCAVVMGAAVVPLRAQSTPEQRFFEWTALQFSREEYQGRREAMRRALAASGGGIFLAASGDGRSGGETFRPADDFLYFTGLELPSSVLVLDTDRRRTVLFVPRRDARFEYPSRPNDFPGRPLADDPELASRAGIDDVRPIETLAGYLAEVETSGGSLRIDPGTLGALTPPPVSANHGWSVETGLLAYLQAAHPSVPVRSAFSEVARVRMVKSPAEIAVMRRAAGVTVNAIREAARLVRNGVDERSLEGALEAAFKRRGAQRPAFASIVKSGPNSLWPWRVLASHYNRRNRQMRDGELVIFDVGAEVDYYVSDVGRTFPVSGRFTDLQRSILQMEVAVADAIIAAVKPGRTLRQLRAIGDSAIPRSERAYMQTGVFFGHHIGLATGDPSLPHARLEPGMVFTVEPWYYNHALGVAVFTEDEILVTPAGAEILTAGLPRTPGELEALVGRRD